MKFGVRTKQDPKKTRNLTVTFLIMMSTVQQFFLSVSCMLLSVLTAKSIRCIPVVAWINIDT